VKLIFTILLFFLFITSISGQKDTLKHPADTLRGKEYLIQNVNRNGVTLPEVAIKEVTVVAPPSKTKTRDYRRYERLVYNIKKVYPYALIVRSRMEKVNADLQKIPDEKGRRAYIKNVEKDVFGKYEGDMRQMTITQGRLLIKLIDRETQNTSYELIRDYRGKITAVFWQGIARIFGTNLKDVYDPFGEDALIELIINEIDAGRL
jgi:hypothetical protein